MSEKHYPYYGGNFDRIIFDKDGSVWVSEAKLRDVESENASLRGAAQGLGILCDRYKAENKRLRACLGDGCADCAVGMGEYADSLCDPLNAENAKLRELVLEIWRSCPVDEDDCKRCPHYIGESDYWCDIPIRMEELGIEVD